MTGARPAPVAGYIDCHSTNARLLASGLDAIVPELVIYEGDPDGDELIRRLRSVAIALVSRAKIAAPVLEACPGLKAIVFLGTGASDYIDLAAAERCGIEVLTVRHYGDRSIAEHAFALALAACREVAPMDRALRAGAWTTMEGLELASLTLGIVGTGGVGSELVKMAAGFGMGVVAWNRSGPVPGLPCRFLPLEDVLTHADVLSLHLALTPETRHFLGPDRLGLMRPGAILVNTARGALVDEAALIEALEAGRLRHAALDVFDQEPLPSSHPLRGLANVTLTAHAAFKTTSASRRLFEGGLRLVAETLART
ncbi:dehydrogenase [Aliidongia dinghuensis]|uniref:Dehydrogenase n=1 Tax=Aliidongia dinghuensis TaxID=1867774 RepID=A0A8J3E779_9PROT|nr:D-isomer specific 2-hydroxyacid dehydrogenase family protein [Aliidongia dinghuensis]GGF49092.1 dehydrogenase [Aliidongia dinghuensis]